MSLDIRQLHKQETHRDVAVKFLLLLAVLLAWFAYLSYNYGIMTGGIVAAISWSFFVLCTPVADAGFLLDFPVRLIFGIRMLTSEIIVWVIAIGVNIYALIFTPEMYDKSFLTGLFKKILLNPYPYWAVIFLSGIGTFLSIYFGDEMLDVLRHRDRAKFHTHHFKFNLIAIISLFVLIFLSYYHLLESLDIHLPD